LKKLGTELKFAVHGLAAVSLDGRAVSSTRIREAIARGDLDAVSQMLGRAYSLAGTVVRAMVWAGNLGFPPLTSTPPASLCRRTVCMPSTPRFGLRPSTLDPRPHPAAPF